MMDYSVKNGLILKWLVNQRKLKFFWFSGNEFIESVFNNVDFTVDWRNFNFENLIDTSI